MMNNAMKGGDEWRSQLIAPFHINSIDFSFRPILGYIISFQVLQNSFSSESLEKFQ